MLKDIYTVSRLNREARSLLEGSFPLLLLEAEISNLAKPASGHWYLSLKDKTASVRCAMFRNHNQRLRFKPENGAQVLVRARISLYEARGEFQLIIEHMEEAGDGALQRAFEELKQRLNQEGLFDQAHKQALPAMPRQIGIITSPTGAAVHDILTTLQRRFPAIPVVLYPVAVQGDNAAREISTRIQLASQRSECDVLILARGGGSLEDLRAFNDEAVARAIYHCKIPIVSGVGHEVDFSIADFVADHRAATPTAAAEQISPDQQTLLKQTQQLFSRLKLNIATKQKTGTQQLYNLKKRLRHPGHRLQEVAQQLDDLELRMQQIMKHRMLHWQHALKLQLEKLQPYQPGHYLEQQQLQLQQYTRRLQQAIEHRLQQNRQRLHHSIHNLNTVSPLSTLSRGYTITTAVDNQRIICSSDELKSGQKIKTRLSQGHLISTIEKIEP
ncbi:Exodeoxyribonuclease VII large subunit [hydrothermal vent metagenome]|uniref:Exodeoxyribonuclease VII large subunit n=1 Tax=hydrothermal vent metagenome TaxID=652676 RepID=A0A3B1ARG0_9ZZZZ